MMYAYSDMEGNRQFIHSFYPFRPLFALLPHCWPRKLKFAKYVENTWRYPFTHVYNTLRSYDAWFLRYKVQRTKFCHFGSFFALWPSQQPKKSKILKKLKKKRPRDIIMLHLCIINDNHIMYGSWDKKCNRQFFFHFGLLFTFCSFTAQKMKI